MCPDLLPLAAAESKPAQIKWQYFCILGQKYSSAVQQAPPPAARRAACLRPREAAQRRTSMGQAVAALGAAAGEYLASIGGSHPLAEAVFFGALALFGLRGKALFFNTLLWLSFLKF